MNRICVNLIFYDVDTQNDFFLGGRLAIPHADSIRPNLERLTQFALEHKIPLFGSLDAHSPDSEEFPKDGEEPNYSTTFPPHCILKENSETLAYGKNSYVPTSIEYGASNIKETRLDLGSAFIPRNGISFDFARHLASSALKPDYRKVLFQKDTFNVFDKERGNAYISDVLKELNVSEVVVYGVATDVCVYQAVRGFLKRDISVKLAVDAIAGINEDKIKSCLVDLEKRGVHMVETDSLLSCLQKNPYKN